MFQEFEVDIKLKFPFKGSRKRLRLNMLLGPGATDYLIDLLLTVATERPEGGVLSGWDELDIALAGGWKDDPHQFVDALIKCGLLDRDEKGEYSIHEWDEFQD